MTRKYCLKTSPRLMGFSQRASCKAQGFLKRSSKKYKGKYIVSAKYKSKKYKSKKRKSYSLFSNGKRKPKTKTGYGDEKRAKETLKNIKKI